MTPDPAEIVRLVARIDREMTRTVEAFKRPVCATYVRSGAFPPCQHCGFDEPIHLLQEAGRVLRAVAETR